uniref:Putative p32 protein n=1 Tax=Ixodes ricinus TaxID=34613 RepID=A0A0K8R7P8_IXORI
MNLLNWSSCLWIWFMCIVVECLPKFHLSSRYEYADSFTLTMSYIVDDTLIDDDKTYIEAWLAWVAQQAMFDFQRVFHFTLNLKFKITYLENKEDLKGLLQPNKIGTYVWPYGAISTLTEYFRGQSHFDIICLVTNLKLDDGDMVRNGYGYHGSQTLCEESLPILLAYAPRHHGYSSYMLLSLILDSISPGIGGSVFNVPSDEHDKLKDHLRKCKNKHGDSPDPDDPQEPPLP